MKTASSQMCTAGCMNSCETYVLNIWFVTDGADSRTWQTWRTWRTCPPGDGQFHSQLALPIFSRCTCCDVSSAAHLADIVQCVNGMAAGSGAHNCVVPIPITHTMKVMETRHSRRVQHITGHHMHHHMMMVKANPDRSVRTCRAAGTATNPCPPQTRLRVAPKFICQWNLFKFEVSTLHEL